MTVIVCYTVVADNDLDPNADYYESFETMDKAQARYDVLVESDVTWSVSICGVIKSTDYEPYDWQFPDAHDPNDYD